MVVQVSRDARALVEQFQLPSVFEEARVFDSDAGCRCQGQREILVFSRECAAFAFGQVEVSEHVVADSNRNAQEAVHGRMVVWESA